MEGMDCRIHCGPVPGDVVGSEALNGVTMSVRRLRLTPPQALAIGFAVLALVGGILLSLPVASEGRPVPFIDALFTATSASTVTGLVVTDIAQSYSLFGELVIVVLIQIGGLGLMTVATLVALTTGRRIMLRERLLMQESLGQIRTEGIVRLARAILLFTAAVETTGALLLTWQWAPMLGWSQALYFGLFHSISAFCSAGFDLFGTSLTQFRGDLVINMVISGLLIIGGLGFHVVMELGHGLRWRQLSLHTKVVLSTTSVLIALGTAAILVLELNNPATLAELPWGEKLLASYFQAVTPRTTGFNTLPIREMTEPGLLIMMVLMFIGASPGSTGGGIKTTTFATLLAEVLRLVRGKEEATIFQRRLDTAVILRAMVITLISLGVVVATTFVLLVSGDGNLLEALYESTSAFGTAGLSTGITPDLCPTSKIAIMLTMFVGRVGPLTLAFALMNRGRKGKVRLPKEIIMVG